MWGMTFEKSLKMFPTYQPKVFMICARMCQPQYAELYATREQCQQHLKAPDSRWERETTYCVPIAKGTKGKNGNSVPTGVVNLSYNDTDVL